MEIRRGIRGEGHRESEDTQILEELRCQTVTLTVLPIQNCELAGIWCCRKAGSLEKLGVV